MIDRTDRQIDVLLVEDNAGDADLICEYLAEAEDVSFVVTVQQTLAHGLEQLSSGQRDVVLLDLSLPDSQGYETFKKTYAEARHTPIIVLTGLDDKALANRAVRNGAQDYLVKGKINGELLTRAISYAIERKQFESRLSYLANHDPITGLFNRHRFEEELKFMLAQSRRYGTHGALLWLDFDEFKEVNDTLGHQAGDDLLKSVSAVIRDTIRNSDMSARMSGGSGNFLARLGGDEFAIILPHTTAEQAQTPAQRLIDKIEAHSVLIQGKQVSITTSVGIVGFPEHSTQLEDLISKADLAMYQAKKEGRNRACVYLPREDWQAHMQERMQWVNRIRLALEKNRFVFHAQPILNIKTNRISRYELLLRIEEEGQLILPGYFLGVAERTGLIEQIDRWVMGQALEILARNHRANNHLRLEVNLSGKSLGDSELISIIQKAVASLHIDPAYLVLEITETAAVKDVPKAAEFIAQLKGMNCQFAVDDFGVGFSSFNQLKHLPVDYLKIDGGFIKNLPHDLMDQGLVQAMVQVAHNLGKKTIAEFVEDQPTLDLLKKYGVDYAQGYHVGKPKPLQAYALRGSFSASEP